MGCLPNYVDPAVKVETNRRATKLISRPVFERRESCIPAQGQSGGTVLALIRSLNVKSPTLLLEDHKLCARMREGGRGVKKDLRGLSRPKVSGVGCTCRKVGACPLIN